MRVISGRLGGRTLVAPRGRQTRPTADRVREALFMSLEPLAGLRVVDLFAGSGALGIEALSRGALRADFVESAPAARRALERNLAALDLGESARVWRLELPARLGRLRAVLLEADLVLADPPYGGGAARALLAELGGAGVLSPGARVVVEHHAKDDLPERSDRLIRTRQRRYGETLVSTYRTAAAAAGGPEEER
jgi:16S rRNA (guanine966-N2)-methyltransferase